MTASLAHVRGVADDEESRSWLGAFTRNLDGEAVERLAREMHAEILAAVPELAADADVSRDAFLTVRAGIESFAENVATEPWRPPVVPPALIAFARTLARRRSDLTVLLKAYRYGQSGLWRYVMLACEREIPQAEMRVRVLLLTHERMTRWIEALIERQVGLYLEERDRWVGGALAQRADTIRALLAENDLDVDKASLILGYDLRRHHTALALWAPAASGSAHGRLDALAGELAGALGAGRALTLPSGEYGLWAWVATDRAPDLGGVARVVADPANRGLRVAVGRPGLGAAGFCDSHREAIEAQRIAISTGRDEAVTRYDDVEVLCLLSKDPAAMRSLVRRELGELAGDDPASRRLRETTRVFFARGCNARAAAEELGAHKNTILYRLRRVEEILGAPIQERRPGLDLALILAHAFADDAAPR